MTTLERLVHRVGPSLGVAEVEELLARAVERRTTPSEWHLDLARARHVEPLATSRLAAGMRELARHRLVVTLPTRKERYRVLYRSGLVAALAAHAEEVAGEPDATFERVRQDPFSPVSSSNVVLFNRIDDGALVPDKDRFAARLWSALKKNLPDLDRRLVSATRAALSKAGYEAVVNVVDHAFAAPFEESLNRTAFILVSWQERLSANPGDPLGLQPYIEQVNEALRTDGLRWVTVTIVDDGNGVPARHALDLEIYSAAFADEEATLADAVEPQASVKLRARDAQLRGDPGWGLWLLADALKDVAGYGCLRTGRQLIELDPFAAVGDRWTFRSQVLAPLGGTALQLIIPLEDPQLALA